MAQEPRDRAELSNLLEELADVLGESTGTVSARAFGGWGGMYAPFGGLGWAGGPVQPEQGAPAWPYRTQSAHVVWDKIKEIMPMHTEKTDREIMGMAVELSGIPAMDLTPEDWRMLEMAVEWYRNGTKYVTPPRIGGAPGGPAASHKGYAKMLEPRGAP